MRALLAGMFTLGAGLGSLVSWLAWSRKERRALTAEWRSGYLAGYRTGRTADTYEMTE